MKLVLACLVCVTIVALAASAGAGASATAMHRRAAIRDAARLLVGVVAPPGAVVRSSSAGVGPRARLLSGAIDSAVARRSWTVAGDASAVLSFVTAHLPSGSKVQSTGSGGVPPSQSVIRVWPAVARVLGDRWLQVEVTSRGSDSTLLSAVAQSQWIVARPASERIPGGVRQIDVTSGLSGERPFLSRSVTSARRVRALIRLFGSLPLVQPVAIDCPGESDKQAVVTVTFKRGAAGRAVARARVSAIADFRWPDSVAGWACFPVNLDILGRRRPALAGNVIGPMQRLLGVKLAARSSR